MRFARIYLNFMMVSQVRARNDDRSRNNGPAPAPLPACRGTRDGEFGAALFLVFRLSLVSGFDRIIDQVYPFDFKLHPSTHFQVR